MKQIEFTAQGTPKGQPRVRACIRGKHAGVYDPGTADEWKRAVRDAAKSAMVSKVVTPFDQAVILVVHFAMPRPKSHLDSKGNVKSSAGTFHTSKPDLDNLIIKAIFRTDQMTRDDAPFKIRKPHGAIFLYLENLSEGGIESSRIDGNPLDQ